MLGAKVSLYSCTRYGFSEPKYIMTTLCKRIIRHFGLDSQQALAVEACCTKIVT
jgi:hypothetical protein